MFQENEFNLNINPGEAGSCRLPASTINKKAMKEKITVSKNTMNFVNLLVQFGDFQTEFYNALVAMYAKGSDDLMDEFMKKCEPVREHIQQYLCISIDDNIGSNGFTEI